jgi:hypothetical protein
MMKNQKQHTNPPHPHSAIKTMLLLCLVLAFCSATPQASNILIIHDAETETGKAFTVTVDIENTASFVAFQFDIPLNDQFTYVENSALLSPERKVDHSLSVTISQANVMRVLVFSITNAAFSGNSGQVLSFNLKAGSQAGIFPLSIANAIIGNAKSENIITATVNGSVIVLPSENDTTNMGFSFEVYPNPAIQTLNISYELPEAADVLLTISDSAGRHLITFIDAALPPGKHSHQININEYNFSSTLLFFNFTAKGITGESFKKLEKLVLIKP